MVSQQVITVTYIVNDIQLKLKYSTQLASGSKDIYAKFILDDYWQSLNDIIYVVFRIGDKWYKTKLLNDNASFYCKIPYQAIKDPGHMRVGLMTDTLSTNMCPIDIYEGTHDEDVTYIDVDIEDIWDWDHVEQTIDNIDTSIDGEPDGDTIRDNTLDDATINTSIYNVESLITKERN